MTNQNQELYDVVMGLRGKDILTNQETLFAGLGLDLGVGNWRGASDTGIEFYLQNALLKFKTSPGTPSPINADGPPTAKEILSLFKYKLLIAEHLENFTNMPSTSGPNEINYLVNLRQLDKNKSSGFTGFVSTDNGFSESDIERDKLLDDYKFVMYQADVKLRSYKSEAQIKHIDLCFSYKNQMNRLHKLKEKNKNTLDNITNALHTIQFKQSELEKKASQLKANLIAPSLKKDSKENIKKELQNLLAQLTLLNIANEKLEILKDRISSGLKNSIYGSERLSAHHLCEMLSEQDFNDCENLYFTNSDLDEEISRNNRLGYKVEEGHFKYQCFDPMDLIQGKTGRDRTFIKGEINLSAIGLTESDDFTEPKVQTIILKELENRHHLGLKYSRHPAFDDGFSDLKVIQEDERIFNNSKFIVDEIEDDLKRCKSIIGYTEKLAEKPQKHLQGSSPVNTFVEVMSLADMQTFDDNGEPYFRDEIVNKKTGKADEKDYRTRFGFEGSVVTRGVILKPNEIKRSTYFVNETPSAGAGVGHKNEKKERLVVETSLVESKSGGSTMQILNKSKVPPVLSNDEMKLLAFKMAKERLLQHREGDTEDKIVLYCDGGDAQDRRLSSHIYAALLMLTAAEDKSGNHISIDPSQIVVKGKNCEKPAFLKMTMNSKRDFYQSYFSDAAQRSSMRNEVTQTYRIKRKGMKEESAVKDDADQDNYKENVSNRRTL